MINPELHDSRKSEKMFLSNFTLKPILTSSKSNTCLQLSDKLEGFLPFMQIKFTLR